MKIKLDENMPTGLVTTLGWLGHDVDTAPSEGLTGAPDHEVWSTAQSAGRFLVTQDLDFSDLRTLLSGGHHGLLVVRLKNPTRRELIAFTQSLFNSQPVEEWSGCFVIATETKTRVRHPT